MSEQEIGLRPGNSGNKPTKDTTDLGEPQEAEFTMMPRPNLDLADAAKGKTGAELIDIITAKPVDDFLPWEKIPLPSMGAYYGGRIPDGVIEVRPMGLITDKIMATARLAQTYQALDYIYKHCCKIPNDMDPLDLLVGDRMFILYYLRGVTHGNIYEFSVKCNNQACGIMSTHEYDLNEMARTIRHPKFNKEPIKIVLPAMSEELGKEFYIEARYMRGRDLQVMMRNQKVRERSMSGQAKNASEAGKHPMERRKEEISLDTTVEQHLHMQVETVMGVSDRMKVQQVIARLTARDTAIIRDTLRETEPGIDTMIEIVCPECQTEMKLDLPITETFFRPKK